MTDAKPPFPPFDLASALLKVQAAEDAWNTRDPHRVSLAYTEDSQWRNRDQFVTGRAEIVDFLTAKWERELDYVLRKSLWSFDGNRIAVRFQYEWHDVGRLSGSAATATSSGSSTTGLMRRRKPASTTSPSTRPTALLRSSAGSRTGTGHSAALAGAVGLGDVGRVQPVRVGRRLRPALGRVLPLLLAAPRQQVDQREAVAELFGAAAVGVPGAVHGVASSAQEDVDRETRAGCGARRRRRTMLSDDEYQSIWLPTLAL